MNENNDNSRLYYITLNPLVFHDFTKDSGQYSIATQSAIIPKMASVGDSSTYLIENVYSDSSKSQQVEKFTQAWSLTQGTKVSKLISQTRYLRNEIHISIKRNL